MERAEQDVKARKRACVGLCEFEHPTGRTCACHLGTGFTYAGGARVWWQDDEGEWQYGTVQMYGDQGATINVETNMRVNQEVVALPRARVMHRRGGSDTLRILSDEERERLYNRETSPGDPPSESEMGGASDANERRQA